MQRRYMLKYVMSIMGVGWLSRAYGEEGNVKKTIDSVVRDKGYVDPEDFGAIRVNKKNRLSDSTQAFQDAIDYAIENGYGEVRFNGTFLISKPLHKIQLPSDDGTIAPKLLSEGDLNFLPEEKNYIYACLMLKGNLSLVATNKETDKLIGTWDIKKSPINLQQTVGIVIESEDNYNKTSRYKLCDFSMCNYFIARVVLCIAEDSYESLKFVGCGISGIKLGGERCREGVMIYSGCISGDIIGGWWTNRNSTSQDPKYLPPYPAKDVNLIGWIDFIYTEEIQYAQTDGFFSARTSEVDVFFDDFFFKSKNSKRAFEGGRLSDHDADIHATMPEFYGVSGRARTYISRYGRPISNVVINRVKTLGCHRTPFSIYAPKILGCYINDAYIERSGLCDNRKTNLDRNLFGIDYHDPYRGKNYGVGYSVADGFDVRYIVLSTGNQKAETHNKPSFTVTKGVAITSIDFANQQTVPYFSVTSFDGVTVNEKYRMDNEYFSSMPIKFRKDSLAFDFYRGGFSPEINVNVDSINGHYIKVGNVINISIRINNAKKDSVKDKVIISNLPFSPNADDKFILSSVFIPGLHKEMTVSVLLINSDIFLIKDSSGSYLSMEDVKNSFFDIFISMSYVMDDSYKE
ncbi:hypothetical protein [Raoultella ornithinolytica]|uniref:hypothetical protein n=1 Tax=Raoultella ornithinolytica TaxID=54291 RepID=UPI002D7FB128|nr:hypothetical protein [Raoultella ornithinolytica]MEB4600397.1 hypothetical protein [Raoultella ornithinolytica]